MDNKIVSNCKCGHEAIVTGRLIQCSNGGCKKYVKLDSYEQSLVRWNKLNEK